MEAETERSRPPSSSSKRKPLSDSTNLIIPTTTILRKLCSSLSVSTTPPFPISKQNSKPYNSSANNLDTNSSKSDTSIGSSNFNNYNPNPSTTPQPHLSTPPRVSIAIPGNASEGADEPLVVYSRRQTAEKTKKKGKAVAGPFTCSPLRSTKGNAKFDIVPVSCPSPQKTKYKGKAAAVPFTYSSVEKTKEKGKAVAVPPSFSSLRKTKDKGKAVSVPISRSSVVNTRNKGKGISMPCPPLSSTRRRQYEFNEAGNIGLSKSCTVPHAKHKKKRCLILPQQDASKLALPQEYIEQQRAYFKEIDEFELPEEEILENELDKEERN